MKLPLKQVSSLRLRNAFPDVALKLETQFLYETGQRLELKIYKSMKGKSAELSIMLTKKGSTHPDQFIIRLSPILKGPFGYKEWFWIENPDASKSESRINAKIKYLDISRGTPQTILITNIEAKNFNHLIHTALNELEDATNQKFLLSRKND